MTFKNLDVSTLPFPDINSRCALVDHNIPSASMSPEHINLCRQGPCGDYNNADDIVTQAEILNQWQINPTLSRIFLKQIQQREDHGRIDCFQVEDDLKRTTYYNQTEIDDLCHTLDVFAGDTAVRIQQSPFSITNGRHRLCAAKKFGVKLLLIDYV